MRRFFRRGKIPQSIWSAPAKYLLASIPKPNAGDAVFETASAAETLQDNKGGLRADWTHGNRPLTGYYFLDQYSLDNPYPTGTGGASVPGFDATSNGRAQLLSLEHTVTIGSTDAERCARELHAQRQRRGPAARRRGPSLTDQGFTGYCCRSSHRPKALPMSPSTTSPWAWTRRRWCRPRTSTKCSDAFSRIVGKHGLKFGGEMHASQINTHPDVVFNGSFGFNGSETGVDFADFLLGVTSSYTQGQAESFYNRNLYMAAFAQDSWKAERSLTLNYGVRWDRIRPWLEKYNQLQTLVKGEQSQVFPGAPLGLVFPGDPGVPASLAPPRNNFSPRAGIAYSPAPAVRQPFGEDHRPGRKHEHSARLRNVLHGIRGIVGGNHERESAVWLHLHFCRAAAVRFAVYRCGHGRNAGQRFPLQHVAYGASRANPNATVELEPV